MQVVLCYDISDDSRRQRMAREVVRHLDRVQKSTFEGDIAPSVLDLLRKAALAIIDHTTDSVRIYYLCAGCRPKTEIVGIGLYIERDGEDIVI